MYFALKCVFVLLHILSDLFQNTLLLYLVFLLCYLILVPLQLYAVSRQHHPVTRLFTASLLLEFVGLMFNVIDVIKYSMDGVGVPDLAVAGDILDILSRVSMWLMKGESNLWLGHDNCEWYETFRLKISNGTVIPEIVIWMDHGVCLKKSEKL